MSNLANKTSLKVPYQLPEFIRSNEDYQTFVSFIQAYYEWMEQYNIGSGKLGAVYGSQNLLNYTDVDFSENGESYNRFIDYFMNDFLPNFPKEILADKAKLLKLSRELYDTKGTPASYKFLFRALYNSEAQIYSTRDTVFRASDGKWYVSKSLRLDTGDQNFLLTSNYRMFGETSKSIATIERAKVVNGKIEVYISNIERLFLSGEVVKVVDNNNQDVYFKDGKIVPAGTSGSTTLSASVLGSISNVDIRNNKRGQLYVGRSSTYSGDPVVFYGGLNSPTGVGARAFVNETTSGSISQINVIDGGEGYRLDPNTFISFSGPGAGLIANVTGVDATNTINVAQIPINHIANNILTFDIGDTYTFFPANTSATVSSSLANAFSFAEFSTFPISSIKVNNSGGGFSRMPSLLAESIYDTNDLSGAIKGKLASLGMLGKIRIVNGGTGYSNGDFIVFSGGTGYGANANVSVNATGTIISAEYKQVFRNNVPLYPKGGLGYKQTALPTLSVQSTGTNAVLTIENVLGAGADLEPLPDERGIGAITSFVIENFGEDYISAPNVSLRVRDLVVTNVTVSNLVKSGELIYQGNNANNSVFKAFVDSISLLESDPVEANSKYLLRTYNYTSNTKTNLLLNITDRVAGPNIYLNLDNAYSTFDGDGNYIFREGVRTYGNGAAQAAARFLSGLIIGEGQYINDDGFPSSYQILQDEIYNNFTYQLLVEKSFSAYKEILFKLLHPSGTKIVPINVLKNIKEIDVHRESFLANSHTLGFYTGDAGSSASIFGSLTNTSNNIIKFNNLVGSNLESFIFPGSKISLNSNTGPNVYSSVISVSSSSNTIVIQDNVFLAFANVAFANVTSSNSKINIIRATEQYNVINNGEYSNPSNPIQDIVFNGDTIRVYANATNIYTGTVSHIVYSNNAIFVSPAPTFNTSNGLVSITRNVTTTDVNIYDTLGTQFYPELTTESDEVITTEDSIRLVLG